jgi:hypothetical protein
MHRYDFDIDRPQDYEDFDPSSLEGNGLDANLRREPYDGEMTLDVTAFMRLIDAGTFR